MKKFFSFVAAAFVALTMNAQAISVADAIAEGMKLDSMGVSEAEYTVEGFVINAGSFSLQYMNQSWYMADEEGAAASDFQAYNCYPIEGSDTLKVLNGDKVAVTGKLKKYYNKSQAKYIIEIEKGDASFISKVDGDHSVVIVTEEITIAQALEIGAALADNASTEKQYKLHGFVSAINVKSSDAYSDQYKNQSFWVMDQQGSGQTNAEGAFYVYRGKPETEAEIPVGTEVEFTCTIKKYVPNGGGDPIIENADQNITIKILGEAPTPEAINVATACEEALKLGDNEESTTTYAVSGYVAKVHDKGYNTQYGSLTFYMTDDPESTYGELTCYQTYMSEAEGTALAHGDRVLVIGKLMNNFYNDKNTPQIKQGKANVEWKQAIENIILTEKVNKVIVDGNVYIVRDGKLFNMQGAQVR